MRVLVIGGGPGGYVAAIKAAQLGAEVVLVEKEKLGGTCLNEGCIPTKVLLHSSELYSQMTNAHEMGIDIKGSIEVNWEAVLKRKDDIVNSLVSGVSALLEINKIRVIKGTAEFETKNSVIVKNDDGSMENIYFDNAIIATGSKPFMPKIKGSDLTGVINSSQGLMLDKIPKTMTIIGGGVIGVEFADIYNSLGCKVTIIEMAPYILPAFDIEISETLRKSLVKKGIAIYTGSTVNIIEGGEGALKVIFNCDGKEQYALSEKVLISVGRQAFTKNLGIEKIGIVSEHNKIAVNEKMETNIENIYAIGDCTGKNMLAHVASEQGIIAVENILGLDSKMEYDCIPAGVYTSPEVACVGLTEEAAKSQGIDYKIGKFPLAANGKALIVNEIDGMIKIIADRQYGQILGVHIIGPRATDIIAEAAIAIKIEATAEEIISTIHAHPTINEAIKEAALNLNGRAIHC